MAEDDQPDITTDSAAFNTAEAFIQDVLKDAGKMKLQWDTIDDNRSTKVSLAEIGGYVKKVFGEELHNAPALMRAYKKTCLRDGDGDDWVERNEFPALLRNILYFNRAYVAFDEIDSGDDRRIDFDEFKAGLEHVGLDAMEEEEAKTEFEGMDKNDGGQILFDEFCAWLAEKKCPVNGEVVTAFATSDE